MRWADSGGELGKKPEYGYAPQHLENGTHSAEFLQSLWNSYNGSDAQNFLKSSIFGTYGIEDPNNTEIETATAQKNKTSFRFDAFLGDPIAAIAGVTTRAGTSVELAFLDDALVAVERALDAV